MSEPQIPVLDIDPYDFDTIVDPLGFFEVLREAGPVVYFSKYNTYATGRYAEVRQVLEDWKSFTSASGVGLLDINKPNPPRAKGVLVEADPPQHTAIRATLQKIISPKIVRGWEEDFDREARKLADKLADMGEVDGVYDVAEAFITSVFPPALGITHSRENLIVVGDFSFNQHGPENELYLRAKTEFDKIKDWYEGQQKRENLLPDGFGEQLFRAEENGDFAPGVAVSLLRTFLRAGMDTTISGIGSTLMYLAQKPQLWASLRQDRAQLKFAFEEAIRLQTPTPSWYRTTTSEIDFAGYRLKAGVKMHIFAGAANRDPRRFPDPDSFDLDRGAIGHLALGRGIHLCIGQMIARSEAFSLLNALLDRFETIEQAGEAEIRPINNLRTWKTMPLRLKAA